MSGKRHSGDMLTDDWRGQHTGWQVVDHQITVS